MAGSTGTPRGTDAAPPRARRQVLLGIAPLLVLLVACAVYLALGLPGARAPLAEATETAIATVVRSGAAPEGRGVVVTYRDTDDREVTATIVLATEESVPPDAQVGVQYAPDDPDLVYADGDAAHRAVADLVFGLLYLALVLVVCGGISAFRLATRPRLFGRTATTAAARRVRVRFGLRDRTWLVLEHAGSESWVPVYWDVPLSELAPGSPITLHGNPRRDRLIAAEIDGVRIWPSGRRRDSAPKGEPTQPDPRTSFAPIGWARQVRADAALVFFAPLFGLLWAYVDGSGATGFWLSSAVAAGVLFWLPSIFGSDPTGPRDDEAGDDSDD